MAQHIHLDLVGGLSGDMFIGAMLDVFPDTIANLQQVIVLAGFPELVRLDMQSHNDGTLTGTKFRVSSVEKEHHHHRHYSEIRERLAGSALAAETKKTAQAIFRLIAEVEAGIHGKKVDEVAFHEVGAWDSIADVVLAAHLIVTSGANSWSVSKIPLGSGFVETAHGRLPVPVPATAKLLEGFAVFDDGIAGERVTPTGAAILKFLAPSSKVVDGLMLARSGFGFGTKEFPGLSNVVRACEFVADEVEQDWNQHWKQDQVIKLAFELDDQTPESIANALELLREEPGVVDVAQHAYFGKKNRQGFSITVLATETAESDVIRRCFELTTTLGVRRERVQRATLVREEVVVYVNERAYRVKVALRPGGHSSEKNYTAKIEMNDLLESRLSYAEQQLVRGQAELLAIQQVEHS